MNLTIEEILNNFPVRISVTDYCNLNCIFCSNEGMGEHQKNKKHMPISDFEYLVNVLAKNNLKNISLTGGDPTLHPERKNIFNIINDTNIMQSFFHTNGVCLDPSLWEYGLDKFSKIAVSIHGGNKSIWSKMTGGKNYLFQKIQDNLKFASENGFSKKIEIKHVVVKGYNDSKYALQGTLDLCSEYGFKIKFLNFEPIKSQDIGLVKPFQDTINNLRDIGCKITISDEKFRGQDSYLPITRFSYASKKPIEGVAIEIGCGKESVCKSCYKSNEIFITPDLKIKPCHARSDEFDISKHIQLREENRILDKIVESRIYLKESPGKGTNYWTQQK